MTKNVIGTLFALKDKDGEYIQREFVTHELDRDCVEALRQAAVFETSHAAELASQIMDEEGYGRPEIVTLEVREATEVKKTAGEGSETISRKTKALLSFS